MALARSLGPLASRDFRLMFGGQAVSDLGDKLVPVALTFAVLEVGHSGSALGLVLGTRTFSSFVVILTGGVLADRYRRADVMRVADAFRATVQATLGVLLITHQAAIWQFVLLASVYGCATAIFNPAATGLVPSIAGTGQLRQANALLGVTRSTAGVVGPAIAGVLVAAVGPGWALLADSLTFVANVMCLTMVRTAPGWRERDVSLFRDLRQGWNAFRERSWIWVSVVQFSLHYMLVLGPFFVLGPLVAQRSLGGATGWATVLSAAAAGAVVGGLVALAARPARPLLTSFVVYPLYMAPLALLALRSSVIAVALAAAAAQASTAFFRAMWQTSLQDHVPPALLSRISAYDWMVSIVCYPLGLALAGPIGDRLGVSTVLWTSVVFIGASTLVVLAVPSVRDLRARQSGQLAPQGRSQT